MLQRQGIGAGMGMVAAMAPAKEWSRRWGRRPLGSGERAGPLELMFWCLSG
jgi:hypothetical protein